MYVNIHIYIWHFMAGYIEHILILVLGMGYCFSHRFGIIFCFVTPFRRQRQTSGGN